MIMEHIGEIIMLTGFLLVILAAFLPTGEPEVTDEDVYDI